MRNFLIDTDTASDDALAIMMALADPKVRVPRSDDGCR
jgi:inosine-uridine nucleoside N-ribohydrolase